MLYGTCVHCRRRIFWDNDNFVWRHTQDFTDRCYPNVLEGEVRFAQPDGDGTSYSKSRAAQLKKVTKTIKGLTEWVKKTSMILF